MSDANWPIPRCNTTWRGALKFGAVSGAFYFGTSGEIWINKQGKEIQKDMLIEWDEVWLKWNINTGMDQLSRMTYSHCSPCNYHLTTTSKLLSSASSHNPGKCVHTEKKKLKRKCKVHHELWKKNSKYRFPAVSEWIRGVISKDCQVLVSN